MTRLALWAALLALACAPTAETSRPATTPPIASASATAAVTLSRSPSTLPVFAEESALLAALNAAGIHATLIGGSKFETLLGERQRARVFIERAGPGGAGADVLFLDRPIHGVRVCLSTTAAGTYRDQIFIGDRLVDTVEGTQSPSYSISDRYFIQASDRRWNEALKNGLGTVTPPC